MGIRIVELLIEYSTLSLNRPFTYIYLKDKLIDRGFRVLVEFNTRKIVGYVLKVEATNKTKEQLQEDYGFKINEIIDVIDNASLLDDNLLELADIISNYYLAPKIAVLQAMLPPSLRPAKSFFKAPKIAYDQYLIVKDINEEGLSPKQIEILRFIASEEKVLKKEIKSISVVKKLLDLGKLDIVYKEKNRLELPSFEYSEPKILNNEQKKVVQQFLSSDEQVYLLQGVTGSGKTEVYLHICDEYLKQNKTILMLVPEISLTPIMSENFIRRFKGQVAILHSELTPAEKYDEYRRIARGEAKVVVGVRSAIFAPLKDIGVIILDEEHTESYKQDTTPFYHAREVAIFRAKQYGAKVLLGSATPSLESRARAQKGIYHFLRLDKRINEQILPLTTVVNMLDYHNIDRDSYIFSKKLREEIQLCLSKKEQIILLINRRGFSTSISCRKCGHVFKCPNCGIALTYHQKDNMLKCHHCNYMELMSDECPECGSTQFLKTGFGTERIDDEIHRLFPDAKTLRLDSDTAKIRTKIQSTVEAFRQHKADILIGTQMIAKGHDFPNVTLVGIVLADIGLTMPNYRSAERVFQLITQAIGRSGRGDKKGRAIIQTYTPSHYAITMAARQNYDLFYKQEMQIRKSQYYPPYCFMASINISSANEEICIETAYTCAMDLKQQFSNEGEIIGPSAPYISFLNGKYTRVILIKYKNNELAMNIFKKVIESTSHKSQIKVELKIDPYDF